MSLVSESARYGGTVDLYGELGGVPTLLDIKTSRSVIWPEMRHQVCAYEALLIENGHRVDQVFILRVGRTEDGGFDFERVENRTQHLEMFRACQKIYALQKELG